MPNNENKGKKLKEEEEELEHMKPLRYAANSIGSMIMGFIFCMVFVLHYAMQSIRRVFSKKD